MSKRHKSKSLEEFDSFDFVESICKNQFPRKSKSPMCDFVASVAEDADPQAKVIPFDYAAQMEYNWRWWEREAKRRASE